MRRLRYLRKRLPNGRNFSSRIIQHGRNNVEAMTLVTASFFVTFAKKRQMTLDEKYMREALAEAMAAAEEDEVPIGAVLVCHGPGTREDGEVIARGHNMTECLHDPTAHAEMLAITAATSSLGGKYLTDCTLYVTVEPCPMCAGAIAWCQVGRVVYGASDSKRGYTRFSPSLMHPKTEVVSGILADECSSIVTEFFKAKR